MSRPVQEKDTGKARAVRVDSRTFMRLLSVRDMMCEDIGINSLHLNQVLGVLINKYIESRQPPKSIKAQREQKEKYTNE